MKIIRVVSMLALLLLASAAAAQTLTRTYTGGGFYGWAVADVADLDGDGRRDFLVSGTAAGQLYAQSSATGTAIWLASFPGTDSGYFFSSAGNINGSGPNDVIVGAPAVNSGGGPGVARLLSGSDGSLLMQIAAPVGSTQFGFAVGEVGDIDGDGRSDVLVGAPGGAGRAHVFSGRNGLLIDSVAGPVAGGRFGAGVSGLDDLNGDGVREFIVGAPGVSGTGRAYVYSGANRQLMLTLAGDAAGSFGEWMVSNAGDVNADGIADIYVGSYAESNGNGAVYVFSGRDGSRLLNVRGLNQEGLGPGRSAGDVNGDGRSDLIVGSWTYSGAGINQGGRVTVFSGADASVLARVNGTRANGQFGFDAVGIGDVTADGRLDFIVSSAPASAVDLYAGAIDRPLAFALNDGLSGAWSDAAVSKQGIYLEVQDAAKFVTGAWFTHAQLPPANGAGLRWFTVLGPIEADRAELIVYYTRGGSFDTASPVVTSEVGTVSLRFSDCTHATARYVVKENAISGQGDPTVGATRSGVMNWRRITPDVSCASSQQSAELGGALSKWLADPAHHGASAAIVFPDGRLWKRAIGRSSSSEDLRPEHLIHVASITKTMTAALILKLVEQDRLALDDPIGMWLPPDALNIPRTVTVRQLLNHTSGLANYTESPELGSAIAANPARQFMPFDLVRYIGPPEFTTGARTRYTNTSFLLLGMLAELLHGRPLHEIYRSELWQPLALDAVFLPYLDQPAGPVAFAVTTDGIVDPLQRPAQLSIGHGAMGLMASAEAIARWGHALFRGKVLSPNMLTQMQTLVSAAGNIPGESGAGLGLRSYNYLGRTQYGHSGGSRFGSSLMLYDPSSGVSVAVLINQAIGADHFELASELLAIASAAGTL